MVVQASLHVLALLCPVFFALPFASPSPTPHGVLFIFPDHITELAVQGTGAFRISAAFSRQESLARTSQSIQIASSMVDMSGPFAPFSIVEERARVGVRSDFGTVWLDIQSGALELRDSQDRVLASAASPSFTGGSVGVRLEHGAQAKFYGAGGGLDTVSNGLSLTSSFSQVANTAFFLPQYWTDAGYSALAVSATPTAPDPSRYPASWHRSLDASGSVFADWVVMGDRADLYLSPAATPLQGVRAHWQVAGAPLLPPRYALGFLASRWGWNNRSYIEATLASFRKGSFPLDAFIADYGWYTDHPDKGPEANFSDFGWNNSTFPEPDVQLANYKQLGVRFGGIRKPRLANATLLAEAETHGWLLSGGQDNTNGRNLNFSTVEARQWYADHNAHYIKEGVSFWWFDEGETQFFTYEWWNQAEAASRAQLLPSSRFFSISRAFSPGLQRLGGIAVWTGDQNVSWQALEATPGYVCNWALAGVPLITCDIGGFEGGDTPTDLLVRWYQLGTFLGVMRVHSRIQNTPHWPWLYGAAAADVMRDAMAFRMRLLPMFYSLLHDQRLSGVPLLRPLFLDYPTDDQVRELTSQWMVGGLLVCPVVRQSASWSAYLPAGQWFSFNSTLQHTGPALLAREAVPLSEVPLFVRAGSIVPLAPAGLQFSGQLPGPERTLEVQVYPGIDGTFRFVEDDGESTDYLDAPAGIRLTVFEWHDRDYTLSWSVADSAFDGDSVFTFLRVVAFFPSGVLMSQRVPIREQGYVTLKAIR